MSIGIEDKKIQKIIVTINVENGKLTGKQK